MRIKLLLLLITFLAPAFLQAQATFEAYTDARQVVLDSYFEVSFTLKNADGSRFRPPSFSDFFVISGPGRSASTTIVNGRVSKELSYTYSLRPRRKGKFTIGSSSITVAGKTLRTKPLGIEVVEGKTLGSDGPDQQLFVKAELSAQQVQVGQQLILDYKLYTSINIDNYNVLEESGYQGFYAREIRRHNSRIVKEVVNGVQYATKILKRVALFPQQTGKLTIEPMRLQLGVLTNKTRRRNSFFFNRKIRQIPAQTESISVKVVSLPVDAPASFTGAVGRFSVVNSLNKTSLTTDDVLTLRLTIKGDGDIKRVQAPALDIPENFDLYDPKVLEESTYESGGSLLSRKVVEYILVPKQAGNFQLRPQFSYFNPDSAKYISLNEDVYNISVRQGAGKRMAPVIEEETPKAREDIRYLKTAYQVQKGRRQFFTSRSFWLLSLLPFLFLGGVALVKQFQKRQNNIDPLLLKSRKARKAALKRLSVARRFLAENKSREFYDEVSKAMLGYVCDKLQIPLSELSKENVQGKLRSLQVAEEHIASFIEIIQTCETALFAGMDNSEAMHQSYEGALAVLSGIEKEILP